MSHTQLPQPRKNWVKRQRALDSLFAALDARLILVVAGAGYGKTGLLAQFAQTEGFSFSWLALDSGDQDLHVFAEGLVSSLQRCFPNFGQQATQLISSSTPIEQNIPLLVRMLQRELSSNLTQPLCVILDDFHLVEPSAAVVGFLDRFIAELPEDVHLIIASRNLPPLQLGLLIAQQQVTALGQAALRLDLDETRQLIASLNGVPFGDVDEIAANRVFDETEGWLVGLLMTNHISRLREAQIGLAVPRAGDLLGDYLLSRVLQGLPLDLQEFLFRSSILNEISLSFCTREIGWTDTVTWIAEVERRNLFIQPLSAPGGGAGSDGAGSGAGVESAADGNGTTYRYHPLFREFLQQRLRQDDPLRHAQLQHDAGAAYERASNIESAMRHFHTGGWSDDVVRLIEGHGLEFLQRGRYRTVLDWLARLDGLAPSIRQGNHVLWQFEMLAHLNLGHDTEALNAVSRLDELYLRTGDLGRRDGLNMRRGLLLYRRGDYEKALACANIVIQSPFPQPAWAQLEARRIAALCLVELGRLTQALDAISQAEKLAQNLGRGGYEPLARVKLTRSTVLDGLGQTAASMRAVSEALSLAEEVQDGALLAEALVTMSEWLVYSDYRDEQEQLDKTVWRGLELAEATGNQAVRIYGLRILALRLMAEGRPEEALRSGAAGLELARQNTLAADRSLFLALLDQSHLLCWHALQQPSMEVRDRLLRQALTLAREAVAIAESGQSTRLRLQAYMRLGAVQLVQGDNDLAHVALGTAESMRGQFNDIAAGHLCLWRLLEIWQEPEPSVDQLQLLLEVLDRVVETRGQTQFIQAEGDWPWQIYQKLKAETDLAALIAGRSAGAKPQGALVAVQPASTATSVQIKLVEHDFSVRGFGPGQVWRGGELISTAQWGWSIPRELLFYMLTVRQATRAQIGTIFWPEANTATLQSSFHNAKSAIRTALGKPAMVYANGQYSINSDLDYLYDVNSFENLLATASQLAPLDALGKLLEAGELYQDDFLTDFTSEWIEAPRAGLMVKFNQCCLDAGMIALDLNQPDAALRLLERAVQRDDINEELARLLMNLYWHGGNRRAALEAYGRLKAALERDLGISPYPEIEQLVAKIKAE
ncbi:MAG: hypothetical protein M1546_01860 [Chloroflexi bacterium]|nr:hypothetical protein [Chloroflexota bacterium]